MVKCTALLLDIEGVTTSVSFVKETLFPYCNDYVEKFLRENFYRQEILNAIDQIRLEANIERRTDKNVSIVPDDEDSQENIISKTVSNVIYWISKDKKLKSLKHLQGLLLKSAFESGKFKGHMYPDVKPCLKRLLSATPVYIYSSGSVLTQKLLFTYSIDGDLTPLISGYFDISIGSKVESDSYKKIASNLRISPQSILFLTHSELEARAARAAGCSSRLVLRDGNETLTDAAKLDFQQINSFRELPLLFGV
uniref:Enolase-phosphatase E1 n=1 Tax=Parascaris univalens TaxID=6257 RepID=A0A914ZPS9_PARUN